VNLCGVSLGIIGFSNSGCQGGASSTVSTDPSGGNGGGGNGGGNGNGNVVGNGNIGIGSGNTVTAPISAPVNVCGVSGAVAGYANSTCKGGARSDVTLPSGGNGHGRGGNGRGGNGNVTGLGNVSAVSGNTVTAPISAPVNLCGISLALLGFGNSGCQGGATTNVSGGAPGNNGNVTGIGNVGLGSGNTITAPVSAPVDVCSVSVAAGGFANSGCKGGAAVNPPVQPNPSCRGPRCAPPSCRGDRCTPPPVCHGSHCTPPNCQGSHCTPGNGGNPSGGNPSGGNPSGGNPSGTNPSGTNPSGTRPGNPGGVDVTSATMPSSGTLPTTGADLLLLGVAAIGTVGAGAGAVTLTRRRRSGAAS
jgi:hypothetical protein